MSHWICKLIGHNFRERIVEIEQFPPERPLPTWEGYSLRIEECLEKLRTTKRKNIILCTRCGDVRK